MENVEIVEREREREREREKCSELNQQHML
jgi:hypothetical protein